MTFATSPTAKQNRVATVPSPTGGINARDSLANMPETDAIVLNNWWPEPQGCRVRKGSVAWSVDVPGGVGTLAVYAASTGEQKLFTFGATEDPGEWPVGIYDITTKGVVGAPPPTPVYVGLGSVRPSTLQTVNDAGTHLFFFSGGGAPVVVYDSTGFHDITFATGPAPDPPAAQTWYDGPGSDTAVMTSHQGRLWAATGDSSVAWYLPVDALWGQWKAFDFGPQMTLGGAIQSLATWTIDDGNGAEDHLVAITTGGQAIVYGGSDPSNISTWALVGVYTIGTPVGSTGRNVVKVGGDLIVLTQRGLVSMAGLLVSTKVNGGVNAVNSSKVQQLISFAASQYPTHQDWQLFYHAPENMFVLNMPPARGRTDKDQRQLVANLVTEANPWTAFSDIDASHWATFDNRPYFGTPDGRVYRGWTGWKDEVGLDGTGGTDVRTQVQQAYSYFGAPATQKQVGMYRPGFLVEDDLVYGTTIEYDFLVRRIRLPSAGLDLGTYGLWADEASPNPLDGIWDTTFWAGGVFPHRQWVQAEGIGTAASLRMSMSSHQDVLWVATDYSLKGGGVL